MFGVPITLI